MAVISREQKRQKRHQRLRRKVQGTAERPRLCIFKSRRHLYVQILDDASCSNGSMAIAMITTNTKADKEAGRQSFRNIESAKLLGAKVGQVLKDKGIDKVTFDRGGYKYHGLVKALADSVREQGISL